MGRHSGRQKRREQRRGKGPRQPLWLSLSQIAALPATILGAVFALGAFAINLPQDAPALDDNTRLHQSGERVTGTVEMVDEEHHRTKHGGYDVYTPYVTLPVHGEVTTVELDQYAVNGQPDVYQEGQTLPMLVAPDVTSARDIGIGDQAARARLEGAVRQDVVGGSIGTVLLLGGGTLIIVNRRATRRREQKTQS